MTRIGPEPHHGARVRLVAWALNPKAEGHPVAPDGFIRDEHGDVITHDDNRIIPPGSLGTVTMYTKGSGWTQVQVEWDNGERLALLDVDDYVVLS